MSATLKQLIGKLQGALETQAVELYDFSAAHESHQHELPSARNLHLKGSIRSSKFQGLNRLQRERLVYSLLSEEIADGTIHALSLSLEEI